MVQVRVAKVHRPDLKSYLNRIGEITGVSGQFVKVKFPDLTYEVFFLPVELRMK